MADKTINIGTPTSSSSTGSGYAEIVSSRVGIVGNMEVDHIMDTSATNVYSGDDNGKHKYVRMKSTGGSDPLVTSGNISAVFSDTVDSVVELFYIDDTSTKIQITSNGAIDLAGARLDNEEFLKSYDNSGASTVSLISADSNDNIVIGSKSSDNTVHIPGIITFVSGGHTAGSIVVDTSDYYLYQLKSGGDDTVTPSSDTSETNWRKLISELETDNKITTSGKAVKLATVAASGSATFDTTNYGAIEVILTSDTKVEYYFSATTFLAGVLGTSTNSWKLSCQSGSRTAVTGRHIVKGEGSVTINVLSGGGSLEVFGWPGGAHS